MGNKGQLRKLQAVQRAFSKLDLEKFASTRHSHIYRRKDNQQGRISILKKGLFGSLQLSKLLQQIRDAGIHITKKKFLNMAH